MTVETRYINSSKGKGLFAKKSFSVDSVLFLEEPLVSCQFSWNYECKYRACDHCLRPLESAEENARRLTGNYNLILPYPECCTTKEDKIVSCDKCGVKYCSSDCLIKASSQYHQTLCLGTLERNGVHPLELLNEAWKNIHYPPETNSVMLVVRLLARIIQSDNVDEAISQTLQFCHRTVNEDSELAHKLLGEKFSDQIDNLLILLQQALPHKVIHQFLTPEGFKSLLALIGTNGQGTGTSALSQWVLETSKLCISESEKRNLNEFIDKLYQDIEEHTGPFMNNEGVALYILQSSANHSCSPNAEVSFTHNNTTLSLVALKDIKEDEEILISYLDECDLHRSKKSRQRQLMENYLFICNCEKCLEDDDDESSIGEDDDEDMDD